MRYLFIILIFLGHALAVLAQSDADGYLSASSFTYAIDNEFSSENYWSIDDFQVDEKISIEKSTNVFIPFYGKCQVNGSGITAIELEDVLGGKTKARVQLQQLVPLIYRDGVGNSGYTLVLPFDKIDPIVSSKLPIQIDSIKISLSATYVDSNLEAGTLKMNDLNLKGQHFQRSWKLDRTVEVKIDPFGWEPIASIDPMNEWNLSSTIEQRYFTIEDFEYPLAIWDFRNGRNRVAKLSPARAATSATPKPKNTGISATPNPAINYVNFELINLVSGGYFIRIKNILGIEVLRREVKLVSSAETVQMDISALSKGSYLYSLEDDLGKIIATKRLIILRP